MAEISLPSPGEPFVDKDTGRITDVWYRYLFKLNTEGSTGYTATSPVNISTANVVSLTTALFATQTQLEASTGSTIAVSPERQQYHPSAAKAWGEVSLAGTVATVNAGYNVNSAASTATGYLQVNLGTAFSSTVYCVVAGIRSANSGTANLSVIVPTSVGLATTSFTLLTQLADGTDTDPVSYYFACYGDQ